MTAPFRARVDFPGLGPHGFERPVRVLEARAHGEVRPLLDAVESAARAGLWAVGHVVYEAAPSFDPALRAHPPPPGPLATFGLFEGPEPVRAPAPGTLGPLAPEIDREEHGRGVAAVRAALAAGDAYQVNLTFRLRGRFEGDPFGLYERLLRGQGGCHGACIVSGGRAVVSASPELFFERRGERVLARPMKGTRPRGRFAEEDARLAEELRASEKDRAENVMIVDLLRNDLGRVAVPGSVRAPALFEVERYRTVHQLVSSVEARLTPGAGLASLLGALFPCGSVTGAPKVAATGIIGALERSPRGAYCGAVGVVRPGGDAVFSVGIRTVELDLATGAAACGVGGGITWGSDAGEEWREALAKGEFLRAGDAEDALVETLRLDRGEYPLLARHLARLTESARHLGLDVDPGAARAALLRHAAEHPGASRRVRLVAGAAGIAVTSAPLPEPAAAPLPVALARRPVSRWDPSLFHKTTRREPYEQRRAEVPGVFDVILWNEEGELTELTIGNLVAELDGVQLTPPRECGLLAGVMRAELLARGEVREATLRAKDLARASRLWLVNAVRGRVPVRLEG